MRPFRWQRAVAEQGDPPENRVERRPQLVRHEPQELVFEAVRFFRAGARRLERGLDALALLDFQPRRDDARFELAAILAHPIENDGDADDEAPEKGEAHGFLPRHRQVARASGRIEVDAGREADSAGQDPRTDARQPRRDDRSRT